jgi:hypothetical protein
MPLQIFLLYAITTVGRIEQSDRYDYDTSWNTPVEITAVICPVVVSYHQEEKTFSICQDHVDLAQQSVAGVEHI